MSKKTFVSRRQFLASTSAAAVGAAALGGNALATPNAPQSFKSPAGSIIPYSQEELLSERGRQRVFTGGAAGEVDRKSVV